MSEQPATYVLGSLGVNQMAYVGQDPSTVEIDGVRFLHVGNGKYQVVTDTEYIETLERAVLASWYLDEHDRCAHCESISEGHWDAALVWHASGCLVPALLAKYGESP